MALSYDEWCSSFGPGCVRCHSEATTHGPCGEHMCDECADDAHETAVDRASQDEVIDREVQIINARAAGKEP